MLTKKAELKPIRLYKKNLCPLTADKDSQLTTLPSIFSEKSRNKINTSALPHVQNFQAKALSALTPDQSFQRWWASLNQASPRKNRLLHIEIGCGQGLHPIRWAQSHSQAGLVALERTKIKYAKFLSRLQSHPITSVFPVHQDATHWLPHNILPQSVDRFYFLYPNPYPKESQANKRWHRSPFFEFVLECLKQEGFIEMSSNLPWYIEEAKLYCQEHWDLKLISEQRLFLNDGYKPQTHFEKKYLIRGEPCTHLLFQKKSWLTA